MGTSLWDTITSVPSLEWGQLTVTPVMLFVPLGLYLLFMANMHLNDRPTLVRATRDFWWLLAGMGGILVLGIPGALARFYEIMHLQSLASSGPRSVFENPAFWTTLFGLYFVIVVGLVGAELRHRRQKTYVYHLDQNLLKPLLMEAFQHEGVAFKLHADRDGATLAFPDRPEAELFWKFKPLMGLCILDWGTTPENVRSSIEGTFKGVVAGVGYTSTWVPGLVFMALASVLIMGSMAISVLQLFVRFWWN